MPWPPPLRFKKEYVENTEILPVHPKFFPRPSQLPALYAGAVSEKGGGVFSTRSRAGWVPVLYRISDRCLPHALRTNHRNHLVLKNRRAIRDFVKGKSARQSPYERASLMARKKHTANPATLPKTICNPIILSNTKPLSKHRNPFPISKAFDEVVRPGWHKLSCVRVFPDDYANRGIRSARGPPSFTGAISTTDNSGWW